MPLARNLFFAIILSTMLAFLLSTLPMNQYEQSAGLAPVFKAARPMALQEENLVDVLSMFDTGLPVTHVKWENRNLFIDFTVTMEKPIYVEDIYTDLFTTIRSTYLYTSNVEGLYVRVLYQEKGKEEVLIAVSAEKSDALLKALESTTDKKSFLHDYTTLSYGVLWKANFQK
ncbi:hypothetical protein [Ammoniphilus sp. CFH 90114]|uniref:hypothetical protein n=1 Tax=Ammoniphilus sp. CFH 90114 TaxID=2493665 RepID=UPI00100E7D70|nr:hypothetical protein [Ammoniphilus sp. CFH 90114]RXT13901.1 hypothetical protein EIZ39_07130 [Ammoniphilus sp. CFH 90114]